MFQLSMSYLLDESKNPKKSFISNTTSIRIIYLNCYF